MIFYMQNTQFKSTRKEIIFYDKLPFTIHTDRHKIRVQLKLNKYKYVKYDM